MTSPEYLYQQMTHFIQHMDRTGAFAPETRITEQYRTPADAHRYSTAYHIITGQISLADLRNCPIDIDGNIWFRPEWEFRIKMEAAPLTCLHALVCTNAASNAREIWQTASPWNHYEGQTLSLTWPNLNYAQEGYPPTSERRSPNLAEVSVSRHIDGLAIDVALHLDKLDDVWDISIDEEAASYGLCRPYGLSSSTPEPWHFELI